MQKFATRAEIDAQLEEDIAKARERHSARIARFEADQKRLPRVAKDELRGAARVAHGWVGPKVLEEIRQRFLERGHLSKRAKTALQTMGCETAQDASARTHMEFLRLGNCNHRTVCEIAIWMETEGLEFQHVAPRQSVAPHI